MVGVEGVITNWWVVLPVAVALAAVAMVIVGRRRQREQAARGWRSRASELYSRSVALHDRLASSLGVRPTLSPDAIDRLSDAEWLVDDVRLAVDGLAVGAPDEGSRSATNDLATSLGSVREGIRLRVRMPESADACQVVSERLADLQESLGRFRSVARNGAHGPRLGGAH
jgi:hypothetical protein